MQMHLQVLAKAQTSQSWRDGSEGKRTPCFSRGPEFNAQEPHGSSQPFVMESDPLCKKK